MHASASKSNTKSARVCPCCGWVGAIFDSVHWGKEPRPADRLCPQCKTCERHRRTCAVLGALPQLLQKNPQQQTFRLLHFGPQQFMERELMKGIPSTNNIDQVGLDFFARDDYKSYSKNTLHADVSNLQLPPHFANGIIILHVLEHVPEIDKAFSELKRVLYQPPPAPGSNNTQNHQDNESWMLVEVPFLSKTFNETRDCRDKKTDEERLACAGQFDHVWHFARLDFEERLAKAGFNCQDVIPMLEKALGKELLVPLKLDTYFHSIQYLCRLSQKVD